MKEFFRNTTFGDILEALGIWQFPSNFQIQPCDPDYPDKTPKQLMTRDDASEEVDIGSAQFDDASVTSESGSHPFLVDWNGPDDPENPQNWNRSKKTVQISIIMIMTSITYAGSSIYVPGQLDLQKDFHVGHVPATLPLSIYVLGYGIGPLLLSPLSELARIGRMRIYVLTLFLFCIFQLACASVKNIGGMIVLRFISGILSSPALATAGASMGDMIHASKLLFAIGAWAGAATAAPACAPLLGSAMLVAVNWKFIFWFLAVVSGVLSVFAFLFMAESSPSTVLHRRASRIRKETGNANYYTLGEKQESETHIRDFLFEVLFRPIIIQFKEPGVLAFNLYIAVCYGSFYLFFESFPIVFVEMYHFSIIELSLSYLGFAVGLCVAYVYLVLFKKVVMDPAIKQNKMSPEVMLKLPLSVSLLLPASVIFFGWTAQIHWILPIISEIFFMISVYSIFQGVFGYLSLSYPRYIASVFAINGFMRALFACGFPLFGTAMYRRLATDKYPVGWGSTLVAFLTLILAFVGYVFYRISPRLRARSEYAN